MSPHPDTAGLSPQMREALLLLHDHGWAYRSTGRRERWVGTRFILPAVADALDRRGLVNCHQTVSLSPPGKEVATALAEERSRDAAERERERRQARAEGMPPPPHLRVVKD